MGLENAFFNIAFRQARLQTAKHRKCLKVEMGKLRDILTACIDHVLAPECAFDPCSNGYAGSATTAANPGQKELFPMHEPDWHNNWGTAVDFQALSDNAALAQSISTATCGSDSFSSSSSCGGSFGEY